MLGEFEELFWELMSKGRLCYRILVETVGVM